MRHATDESVDLMSWSSKSPVLNAAMISPADVPTSDQKYRFDEIDLWRHFPGRGLLSDVEKLDFPRLLRGGGLCFALITCRVLDCYSSGYQNNSVVRRLSFHCVAAIFLVQPVAV